MGEGGAHLIAKADEWYGIESVGPGTWAGAEGGEEEGLAGAGRGGGGGGALTLSRPRKGSPGSV